MNEVNLNNNELFEEFELIAMHKLIDFNETRLLLRDFKTKLFNGGAFEIITEGNYLDEEQLFYFPYGGEKYYVRDYSDLKNIDYRLNYGKISDSKILLF